MARQALGKGLGALIGTPAASPAAGAPVAAGDRVQKISVERVMPSPLQPRKTFTELELSELAASIKENGILQPLIVRENNGKFELIAGERRWRAAQLAGLPEVPLIVRTASDIEVLEFALVENLQRADLNPIEEADGYAALAGKFKLTQEQIADKVGKSRASVANALRLRGLQQDVREMVRHGQLSAGHAKVLLGLEHHAQQLSAAKQAVGKQLSVRQTEELVRSLRKTTAPGTASGTKKASASADWRELELKLQRKLGTKVRMVGGMDKGHVELPYYSADDFERLLGSLGVKLD
jgi:ParB family chromosome partitioning protein